MIIVQSLDLDCAILLGNMEGVVYQDLDAVEETFKMGVQWWRTKETSNNLKVLYRICLEEIQQWVVDIENNYIIDIDSMAWYPRERWRCEFIIINAKGHAVVKVQQEHVKHDGKSLIDVHMNRY